MARWANRIADLLLPACCAGCGDLLSAAPGRGRSSGICPRCATRLKAPPYPRCSRCQAPRGTGLPRGRECGECRRWPSALESAGSVALLVPPADALVKSLKYGGWHRLASDLAEQMVGVVHGPAANGAALARVPSRRRFVPVPTTPGRLRRRGYNQARLLAAEVSARTGGTLVDALVRAEGGRSQVGLRPGERWANVERVFSASATEMGACVGEDVILVDDVLTTGATAAAAATVLVEAGARSVRLVTFARSLPQFE